MSSHSPKRCPWPTYDDPLYLKYHDKEWGVPVTNDKKIFEYLILEAFQAGLSWRTILHKRKNFKKAFAGFDYRKIAAFNKKKKTQLLKDPGIIRNRAKIEAAVINAGLFIRTQKEFGSFSQYMWSWVKGKPIVHKIRTLKDYPTVTDEALAWAKDLKARGFKFLGPTTLYAHMQAVGMVNDHTVSCFRHRQLAKAPWLAPLN